MDLDCPATVFWLEEDGIDWEFDELWLEEDGIDRELDELWLEEDGIDRELDELWLEEDGICLLYTSPSPRDQRGSRMPSSA